MALRLSGFPSPERRALDRCLVTIKQRLEHPPGPMPHDLREQLLAILLRGRPVVDLVYAKHLVRKGKQGPAVGGLSRPQRGGWRR